jgi:hypothetical protein
MAKIFDVTDESIEAKISELVPDYGSTANAIGVVTAMQLSRIADALETLCDKWLPVMLPRLSDPMPDDDNG